MDLEIPVGVDIANINPIKSRTASGRAVLVMVTPKAKPAKP